MSVRLSFGSRAGGSSDYHGTLYGAAPAQSHWSRGPFESLDGLTESLSAEIAASRQSAVPDCTTVELRLNLSAELPLHRPTIGPYAEGGEQDLPQSFKTVTTRDGGTTISDPFPRATVYSIVNFSQPRERQIVQRAASRGIIAALEASDGYRYSFNNAWNAKDEEGSRFSYICQDSMQNKDRHANGFTRTLKHLKREGERGPRKPTYDCKGSVSIKFSTTKQSVNVYYRHYAIHPTVAERKPLRRQPPQPRTGDDSPADQGGLAAALQAESIQTERYASSALEMVDNSTNFDSPLAARSDAANNAKSLKRKRESYTPTPTTPHNLQKPLSLMDLLRQSETANTPSSLSEVPKPNRAGLPPPVNYELPSWQIPPPPLNRSTGLPAPYPPSYNPSQSTRFAPIATPTIPLPPKPSLSMYNPTKSHPQAQGLFTTMKQTTMRPTAMNPLGMQPVSKEWVVPPAYHPGIPRGPIRGNYNTFHQPTRAKQSCTMCRTAKRKCDEGNPCGACAKLGRTECVYEPWTNPTTTSESTAPQRPQQSGGAQQANTQNAQASGSRAGPTDWAAPGVSDSPAMASAAEGDSPDPWFPKR